MSRLAQLTLLAALLFRPARLPAQDNTFKEIESAVKKWVVPAVKKEQLEAISIGGFHWSNGKVASCGAGLAQRFADFLGKENIGVVPGGRCELRGVLESIVDPRDKRPVVRLTITLLVDSKTILEKSRVIYGEEDVATLEGTDISFPAGAEEKERGLLLVAARTQPRPAVEGERTRVHSPDRKVSVEMLLARDQKTFEPRKLDREGRVPVAEGETYQIRIANEFDHEIAVRLSIDGIAWDHFARFEQNADGGSMLLLVPPHGSSVVRGWAKNAERSFAFDVARLPVLAVARKCEIGTITLAYSQVWVKGQPAPEGESNLEGRRSMLGTERIREQTDAFTVTERQIGKVRGVFSVRYGEFK